MQRYGLVQTAHRLIGQGQVVSAGEGVRVVGAEQAVAVGQRLLVQRYGLVQTAHRLIGQGQVVSAGEGVRVVGAE